MSYRLDAGPRAISRKELYRLDKAERMSKLFRSMVIDCVHEFYPQEATDDNMIYGKVLINLVGRANPKPFSLLVSLEDYGRMKVA